MTPIFERYRQLQTYVGWTDEDAARVRAIGPLVTPAFGPLIDDFYDEISRHPNAAKVITGGPAQVQRLKGTLIVWLRELFCGDYNADYVQRRWRVGWRHVDIGLDQVYTNVALARLRTGLTRLIRERFTGSPEERAETMLSLNKLLDLDLAIIEDAYQAEYLRRREHAERLATIGQVASGVAHELRQPLNVVKTSVYFLRNARSASDEKKAEHLARIDNQVDLANRVITAMSNFAKLRSPATMNVPLRQAIEEAIRLNPLGQVAAHIQLPDDLPPVAADPDQLQIVLGNLLRNAREAMEGVGSITFTAEATDTFVTLHVADSGPGIKPEDIDRIMQPLFTTKARGLGLGLAITRAIIEKHSGRLTVHSTPGQGATFTVILPTASAVPQEVQL